MMKTIEEINKEKKELGKLLASGISGDEYKKVKAQYDRIKTQLTLYEKCYQKPNQVMLELHKELASISTLNTLVEEDIKTIKVTMTNLINTYEHLLSNHAAVLTRLDDLSVVIGAISHSTNKKATPEVVGAYKSKYGAFYLEKLLEAGYEV